MNAPNPSQRFKPRAEASILSRFVQDAWTAKNEALKQASESASIGEIIAAHLERLFPASDMAVLAKYGHAKPAEDCTVHVPRDGYGNRYSISLPRAVMVPDTGGWAKGNAEAYACCTRYSEMPGNGLKPSYRATLSDEAFEAYLEDHRQREAKYLPREVDPFFQSLADAHAAYKAEYRQATAWPAERKAETGAYPTWAEIAARFPVLGAHIAALNS